MIYVWSAGRMRTHRGVLISRRTKTKVLIEMFFYMVLRAVRRCENLQGAVETEAIFHNETIAEPKEYMS